MQNNISDIKSILSYFTFSFDTHLFVIQIIDILIVAYLIYRLYYLISGTIAIQLLKGIIIILFGAIISKFLQLETLNWILTNISTWFIISLIIIFQPELRRILTEVGENKLFRFMLQEEAKGILLALDEIVSAIKIMASEKVGSLIVIERKVGLREYIERGIEIDAKINNELIRTIFFENSPLHDGAIIISNNRISSAGCYLPLSYSPNIKSTLGARHRAGLGIAEQTDAISIITSEETGKISIATEGKLIHNIPFQNIKQLLAKHLQEK